MAAVMTADMDNTEKVIGLVDECFRMKPGSFHPILTQVYTALMWMKMARLFMASVRLKGG